MADIKSALDRFKAFITSESFCVALTYILTVMSGALLIPVSLAVFPLIVYLALGCAFSYILPFGVLLSYRHIIIPVILLLISIPAVTITGLIVSLVATVKQRFKRSLILLPILFAYNILIWPLILFVLFRK